MKPSDDEFIHLPPSLIVECVRILSNSEFAPWTPDAQKEGIRAIRLKPHLFAVFMCGDLIPLIRRCVLVDLTDGRVLDPTRSPSDLSKSLTLLRPETIGDISRYIDIFWINNGPDQTMRPSEPWEWAGKKCDFAENYEECGDLIFHLWNRRLGVVRKFERSARTNQLPEVCVVARGVGNWVV
jgi:hypothetical protein